MAIKTKREDISHILSDTGSHSFTLAKNPVENSSIKLYVYVNTGGGESRTISWTSYTLTQGTSQTITQGTATFAYDGNKTFNITTGAKWTKAYVEYQTDIDLGDVYGFHEDKSKAFIPTRSEAVSGQFFVLEDTLSSTKNTVGLKDYTYSQIEAAFGTADASKIHIVSAELYSRTHEEFYEVKAWGNPPWHNSTQGRTFIMPYIRLYDFREYPWTEDRIMELFYFNQYQQATTETIKLRILAFVED